VEALETLKANRRAKLEELRQRGVNPFPASFPVDARVSEIVARFAGHDAAALEADPPRVRVGGRVMAVRGHGKAAFLDLSDGDGKLQVHLKKDVVGEDSFALFGCSTWATSGASRGRCSAPAPASSPCGPRASSCSPRPCTPGPRSGTA